MPKPSCGYVPTYLSAIIDEHNVGAVWVVFGVHLPLGTRLNVDLKSIPRGQGVADHLYIIAERYDVAVIKLLRREGRLRGHWRRRGRGRAASESESEMRDMTTLSVFGPNRIKVAIAR